MENYWHMNCQCGEERRGNYIMTSHAGVIASSFLLALTAVFYLTTTYYLS